MNYEQFRTAWHEELTDVEIVHLLTMGGAPYVDLKYKGHFRHNAFFIGKNVREAVNDGRADFIPIFLYDVPGLFQTGEMPVDVALVQRHPDVHRRMGLVDADPGQTSGPNPLVWNLGTLAAGDGGTIRITVTVNSWVTQTFTNVVSIVTSTPETDSRSACRRPSDQERSR